MTNTLKCKRFNAKKEFYELPLLRVWFFITMILDFTKRKKQVKSCFQIVFPQVMPASRILPILLSSQGRTQFKVFPETLCSLVFSKSAIFTKIGLFCPKYVWQRDKTTEFFFLMCLHSFSYIDFVEFFFLSEF